MQIKSKCAFYFHSFSVRGAVFGFAQPKSGLPAQKKKEKKNKARAFLRDLTRSLLLKKEFSLSLDHQESIEFRRSRDLVRLVMKGGGYKRKKRKEKCQDRFSTHECCDTCGIRQPKHKIPTDGLLFLHQHPAQEQLGWSRVPATPACSPPSLSYH